MSEITIQCPRCEADIGIDATYEAEEPETWGYWGGSPRIPAHVEVNDDAPATCPECEAIYTPDELAAMEKAIRQAADDYEPGDDGDPYGGDGPDD